MNKLNKCIEILKTNSNIIFAYVFGSYARGKINKNSDIDFAIYLNTPQMNPDDYLNIRSKLMDICNKNVDIVILNQAIPLLKYEIYKDGILLFTKNKTLEIDYKIKVLFEYDDIKKFLDLSYQSMINRIKMEVKENG